MLDNIQNIEFWNAYLSKAVDWMIEFVPSLILMIILLMVGLKLFGFSIKKIRLFIINRAPKDKDDGAETEKRVNTLMGIIKTTGKIALYIIFTMMVLRKLGIDIGPILAGAGIVGLAVGFGAQTLVKDIITGFFILLDNEVRVGDVAVINGITGTIESIQLRTITIRDFYGTLHVVDNGKIDTLANTTKEWAGAVIDIGVAYKEDIDTVTDIMKKTGNEMLNDDALKEKIINPIEVLGVSELADSAVIIRARMKTKPHERFPIEREFRRRIKYAFDAKGIEIPFPHTSVYWGEETKPLKLSVKELSKKAG